MRKKLCAERCAVYTKSPLNWRVSSSLETRETQEASVNSRMSSVSQLSGQTFDDLDQILQVCCVAHEIHQEPSRDQYRGTTTTFCDARTDTLPQRDTLCTRKKLCAEGVLFTPPVDCQEIAKKSIILESWKKKKKVFPKNHCSRQDEDFHDSQSRVNQCVPQRDRFLRTRTCQDRMTLR